MPLQKYSIARRTLITASLLANIALSLIVLNFNRREINNKESDNVHLTTAVRPLAQGLSEASTTAQVTTTAIESFKWAENSEDIIKQLKLTSAPSHLIRAVARALISEEEKRERERILKLTEVPFWRRRLIQPDAQTQRLINERIRAAQDRYYELTGELPVSDSPIHGIPSGKAQLVEKIMSDYTMLRQSSLARENKDKRNVNQYLESEYRKDLEQVLTPEELTTFLAYNSLDGMNLQQQLARSDIDDETYVEIFREISRLKDSQPGVFEMEFSFREQQIDLINAKFGLDVTSSVAALGDGNFREIADIIQNSQSNPERVIATYKTYLQFHDAVKKSRSNGDNLEERISGEQISTMATDAYNELIDSLSAEEINALQSTPYVGFLNRFRTKLPRSIGNSSNTPSP